MRRLILGTAGHIDHGKTALVKALTGVDTDRLKEEKERGITVDLGFAEFRPQEGVHFGVVDVPGHEGFIRNMVAGATGMDLVLLVVAADEGVMPQTSEHLAIVSLLGVPRLVVALTKSDLVEPDWLELVREEVAELLLGTPYAGAPILPASSVTSEGLQELGAVLAQVGMEVEEKGAEDLARLPIDRVFTIRGTGTVVTGTLWSGALYLGDRVRVLPGDREGRVRTLQHHGEEAEKARSGGRVAVGLTGGGISHQELVRGQTLVSGEGWETSWMLTCRLSILAGTGWDLEQGQRVRVHLGTCDALARVAILGRDSLAQGEEGWVQLRLEEPLLARVRDHLVIRSYSPMTTMGGGRVAEVFPRKRRSMAAGEDALLHARLHDDPGKAVGALLEMVAWVGVPVAHLPQETGRSPVELKTVVESLVEEGIGVQVEARLFSKGIWSKGEGMILDSLSVFHEREPLRPGKPLEELRQVLPGEMGPKLGEALIRDLEGKGRIRLKGGQAALQAFQVTLTQAQLRLRGRLKEILEGSALSPPSLRELEEDLDPSSGVEAVLKVMEAEGEVLGLDDGLFFLRGALVEGGEALVQALGGTDNLGPAEFKKVLPVSRKHLLPILRYFDTAGVTTRREERRSVAKELPKGWGTSVGG